MKQSFAGGLDQLTSVVIKESEWSAQYTEDLQAAICTGNTRIEVAASKLECSANIIQKGALQVPLNYGGLGSLSRRVGNDTHQVDRGHIIDASLRFRKPTEVPRPSERDVSKCTSCGQTVLADSPPAMSSTPSPRRGLFCQKLSTADLK